MDEEWRPGTGTRSVASIVRVAAADEGENCSGGSGGSGCGGDASARATTATAQPPNGGGACHTLSSPLSGRLPPSSPPLHSPSQVLCSRRLGHFGGVAAAAAVSVQVALFGPLQTTIAFQYRTALATVPALRGLLAAGGLRRLYAGAPYGVAHAALSRGGDTAANAAALSLGGGGGGATSGGGGGGVGGRPGGGPPGGGAADGVPPLGLAATVAATAPASVAAAAWRTALLPLEVARTNLQVRGAAGGGARLRASVAAAGVRALYSGGLASAASTGTGHLVFFSTLNALHARVPAAPDQTGEAGALTRWAGIGLAASAVADTANNGLRVITTAAQTRGRNEPRPHLDGPNHAGSVARWRHADELAHPRHPVRPPAQVLDHPPPEAHGHNRDGLGFLLPRTRVLNGAHQDAAGDAGGGKEDLLTAGVHDHVAGAPRQDAGAGAAVLEEAHPGGRPRGGGGDDGHGSGEQGGDQGDQAPGGAHDDGGGRGGGGAERGGGGG